VAVNATATAVTAVGANDGTATANPSGGVGPYTYMWNNGVTTQTATGLSVGNYTVTVTDANGCTNTQSAFVSAFNCAVNAVVNVTNVSCAGAGNGSAAALLVGGTAPNTYTWNTGATTAILTGLQPGVYTVSVVDANGCAASAEGTVTEPAPLVAEIAEIDNVSCLNEKTGSVVISVTGGGTTPYSFTYPGSGEQLLGVGLYTITVTNTNGCTTLAEFSIVAIDTIAPTIVCPPSVAKCDDGQVTGSELPEAEDNCFIGNLNYELIQGLPNGSLFPVGEQVQVFKVTDQAGNSSTCSFTVAVFAAPDIALVAIGYDTNSLATGYINIAPLGGTLPYTFEWKKDNVFFSTDEDLSGLSAGTYRLVATDANGCVVVVAAFNILGVVGTTIPFSAAGIRVSPNPVDTWINLDYQSVEPAAIEIYDGVGQLVKFINNRDGFNRIDMSLLPAGMYHILLTDIHAQRYIARFVKA
jgi:SprB repeat/HYR domain/Secretion system C-terminal sorting domain